MIKLLAIPWEFMKALFGLAFPMFRWRRNDRLRAAGPLGAWVARGRLDRGDLGGLGLAQPIGDSRPHELDPYGRIREVWLPVFAFCTLCHDLAGLVALSRAQHRRRAGYLRVSGHRSRLEPGARGTGTGRDSPGGDTSVPGSWDRRRRRGALFHAAGIKAQVKQVPRDPTEPLHVTANRDAIWVTCPGASVLGQHNPFVRSGRSRGIAGWPFRDRPTTRSRPLGAAAGETLRIEDFMASLKKAQAHQRRLASIE